MSVAYYILLGALPCALALEILECLWLTISIWYWERRVARLQAQNDRLIREISVMKVIAGEHLKAGAFVAIGDDGRAYNWRASS